MKALVLSAGGALGAYQIGAWRALEEQGWRPDLIVGASIGAVNGFAISRGASGEELLRLWSHAPYALEAQNGVPLHRPGERFSLARRAPVFRDWIRHVFAEWHWRPPKCDLHLTLTEWPSCAVRVVKDPAVTSQHLVGTCAVPIVMPAVCIEGRTYLDGGTFSPLPLLRAIRAGATEIVAVDVLAASPCKAIRWARLLGTSVRNFVRREATEPTAGQLATIRLVRVQSPRPLGSLDDCLTWDFVQIHALAEAGYHAALGLLPSVPSPAGRQLGSEAGSGAAAPSGEAAANAPCSLPSRRERGLRSPVPSPRGG